MEKIFLKLIAHLLFWRCKNLSVFPKLRNAFLFMWVILFDLKSNKRNLVRFCSAVGISSKILSDNFIHSNDSFYYDKKILKKNI